MKISIITVCFNSQETIGNTVESVISQDYQNKEYIVVDGGSTDKTLQILDKYKSGITKLISEKDHGIYFALNKGIDIASGDVIGILHSDDFYSNKNILTKISEAFVSKNTESVYGDLEYVSKNNTDKVVRKWISGNYKPDLFLKGWMPPHPTFFLKKECYQRFGKFNTTFASAADYELMLRMIHKNGISTSYIPEVLVKMRTGGKSNRSLLNRLKANQEDKRAWKVNGLQPEFFTLLRKPLSKLTQFFK